MEMHSTMTWRCGYNFLRHQHVVQVDYTTFIKERRRRNTQKFVRRFRFRRPHLKRRGLLGSNPGEKTLTGVYKEKMVAHTRSLSRGKGKTNLEPDVICVSSGTRSRRQRNSHVACVLFDSTEEDVTPPRANIKRQITKRKQTDYCGSPTKKRKKHRQPAQQIPALNTRSSPKQLFSAMMVLSDRQKESIKAMGFGGLLGLSVNGIPEKLAFHVVDSFDAKSLTLNIGNASLVVDAGLISKLLGIRNTGLRFADVEVAKTLPPSLKAWRARFPPTTYIAPSLISAEIQKDTYSDMAFFRTDFALLFLTAMGSSQQNGYVKDKILKRLTAETRYEDYNWCEFIIECLRKCKKKWRPSDPKCCWVGPLTVLTLLYVDCTQQPACNTGVGVRALHYWTKDLLTRRQDYEIANGGFGRGRVKPLSEAPAENGGAEQASIVDEWLQELAALRSKIEKTLSDRLNLDPDNEDHRRLKRKYLEVLDVLPCLPDEGLETFEEGDMLNRTAGGSSSPPSALAEGVEQAAQDDTNVASDSADEHEECNLNVLIAGIAKTAVEGDGASLRDVSIVCDTFPGTRGAAGGDDADDGADEPDMGNVGAVTACSGGAGYKQAESLEGVNHGEDQLAVDSQGTVSLGENSQVDASVPVETRVGRSDVESPANVGKSDSGDVTGGPEATPDDGNKETGATVDDGVENAQADVDGSPPAADVLQQQAASLLRPLAVCGLFAPSVRSPRLAAEIENVSEPGTGVAAERTDGVTTEGVQVSVKTGGGETVVNRSSTMELGIGSVGRGRGWTKSSIAARLLIGPPSVSAGCSSGLRAADYVPGVSCEGEQPVGVDGGRSRVGGSSHPSFSLGISQEVACGAGAGEKSPAGVQTDFGPGPSDDLDVSATISSPVRSPLSFKSWVREGEAPTKVDVASGSQPSFSLGISQSVPCERQPNGKNSTGNEAGPGSVRSGGAGGTDGARRRLGADICGWVPIATRGPFDMAEGSKRTGTGGAPEANGAYSSKTNQSVSREAALAFQP
ncbi:uncharacterized protein LOC110871593 isoform X3 [Helianthus annuus]|uniref:uncharacterized protein LOC110871593 isoform X3 n=1 Tax=Helianthus annuus TaxID=4232 RepID=UPI001652D7C9|nr:uncharacterized protein LOC110871593 isoform X3 [Helianthus annuus]